MLHAEIDPKSNIVTATALLITLPIIKALISGDFSAMPVEYLVIFGTVFWWMWGRFRKSEGKQKEYQ